MVIKSWKNQSLFLLFINFPFCFNPFVKKTKQKKLCKHLISLSCATPPPPHMWASNSSCYAISHDALVLSNFEMEVRDWNLLGLCSCGAHTSNKTEMEYGSGGDRLRRVKGWMLTIMSASARDGHLSFFVFLLFILLNIRITFLNRLQILFNQEEFTQEIGLIFLFSQYCGGGFKWWMNARVSSGVT